MKKQFILLQVLLSVCLAGQYLVVSHQTLYDNDWYQPLADLKGQFGYTVDHLEITDGMTLDQIVSAVVNHTPRPDVLLLVGDASRYPVEQKQVANAGNGNFMPFGYEEMTVDFILSGTRLFDVASDKLLKDTFENQHGVRPIVGRVPAETVTEIVNWVHKLEAYHHYTTHPTDHEKILLVTDNKDHPSNGGTEWFANKDRDSMLVRLAPSDHQVLQLNSGDYAGSYYENVDARAADFETAVNDGVGLIYTHGSAASERWLNNFYWANADPNASQPNWAFTNTGRYPFLLGMSCSIGKIYSADSNQGYAEVPSVVEKLMFLEDAGIIGAVAPTEDTFSFTLKVIYKALWERFASGGYDNYHTLVQDALDDMLAAFAADWVWWEGRKTWLSSLGTREWEYRSYVFYGDPTMPISTAQYKEDDITQNTTWQGTVVVKSNITINAGATLTIKPGTAVLFDGYRSLIVEDGARLVADGTEDYPILFSSLNGNTPQSWNKLYLRSSDNLLRWCEIEYGNWAVHAYGSPSTDNRFEYLTFRNNDQGLRVENNEARVLGCEFYDNRHNLVSVNNDRLMVEGSRIYDGDRDGVYSTAGDYLNLYGTVIENNGQGGVLSRNGIYSGYNNVIYMGDAQALNGKGYNTIRGNFASEIYAEISSQASIYYNSIHDVSGYEIENRSGSTMSAGSCWWGEYPPDNGQFYGSVNRVTPLKYEPVWEGDVRFRVPMRSGEVALLRDGASNPNPGERVRYLQQVIMNNPASEAALEALNELFLILRADYAENRLNERQPFFAFLLQLNGRYAHTAAGRQALRYMIIWRMLEGNDDAAIGLAQQALNQQTGAAREGLMVLLAHLMIRTEQFMAAREVLNQYTVEYGEDSAAFHFLIESLLDREYMVTGRVGRPGVVSGKYAVSTDYELTHAYPNPFNPVTTIQYFVPGPSQVSLTVYDLMGREVATLVDGFRDRGSYSITFDATDLASGLYLCRLTAPGFSRVVKLSVVK